MTSVQQVLASTARKLEAEGILDAALEAQVLFMHAAGRDRTWLLSSLRESLPSEVGIALAALVQRRLKREPLAYITGHREFFGLDLLVDRRVLVPRQETECLVERVLAIVEMYYHCQAVGIADVGTGSGAIAIALAKTVPASRVFAIDRSSGALALAGENVGRHGLGDRVTLLQGDLLQPLMEPVDIVAANLPYIPTSEWERLQPEVRLYEPPEALLAGEGGLDAMERLLQAISERETRPRWIVLEMATGQSLKVVALARGLFPNMDATVFADLGGLERGVVIEVPAGYLPSSTRPAPGKKR